MGLSLDLFHVEGTWTRGARRAHAAFTEVTLHASSAPLHAISVYFRPMHAVAGE